MVQSPSWAANRFAASQEIPRISLNPKVHYRTHKRPSRVSILGQPNPVHMPTCDAVLTPKKVTGLLEKCVAVVFKQFQTVETKAVLSQKSH